MFYTVETISEFVSKSDLSIWRVNKVTDRMKYVVKQFRIDTSDVKQSGKTV